MNLLSAENLTKSYGLKTLFSDLTFGIAEGEKIGLIGINGTGKSTLLKLLAGKETPDQGEVTVGSAVRVAYLPQNPDFDDEATVLQQIFNNNDYISNDHINKDPWQAESEAKTILTRLGIYDFDAIVGTLSGGQRKRVALAGALLSPADLLILDEPTNHIDNETVGWLEIYLNRRRGALVMITHDRYFLDRVVNRIIELENGRLYSYPGNYSKYLELKLERHEQERSSELKRLNILRNELKWIKRGAKARTTKQKARIERFERLRDEAPDAKPDKMEISVGAARLGKKVIALEGIAKSFSGEKVIDNFSYTFLRDARVGIIGPNGIGKSTLLKIIAGTLEPDVGVVDRGQTVRIGIFSQETREMDQSLRVIQYIKEQAEFITTADGKLISAAQMLERFLFPPELQWTPLEKLSGGEKRRLYLLRVLMGSPNVLLLDEPTNDLDIETLTILEDYLDEFPGVVAAVSHDRYFLDRVVNEILDFSAGGRIAHYLGNYSDYLVSAKTRGAEGKPLENPGKSSEKLDETLDNTQKQKNRPLKFSYKEQQEFEQIDDVISGVEEELRTVKSKINHAGSDYVLLQNLAGEQQGIEMQLEELLERWAYLNELAEEIERNKKGRS
ncbi:ABC-F family ATP-binding cassette domain-containing protein [Phosphitispora fastidiosa]|uniref:ABC-F family ATP-binding cassette domain-containing protein n=1 Tax=Phosphitispora fastidiosa TaxID=2837202 RepID=UPI001E6073D8|nr:ATP-binding cassette subfamily F protein uup [Phosphitispora fastidiosa]